MSERRFVDSICHALIHAPIEQVDLTAWLFSLADAEYQACSKAHIAAGSSVREDGLRVSVNVEMPGDTLMIQHYVEDIARRELCRVDSLTDALTPLGRTRWRVVWQLSVTPAGQGTCQLANRFSVHATDHFLELLAAHGATLEMASAPAQKLADAHNREETPLFALDIERKAVRRIWGVAESGVQSAAAGTGAGSAG